ncbi:MAG: hypothetical protein QNK82_05435 [Akkermansiaceae bacterium]
MPPSAGSAFGSSLTEIATIQALPKRHFGVGSDYRNAYRSRL